MKNKFKDRLLGITKIPPSTSWDRNSPLFEGLNFPVKKSLYGFVGYGRKFLKKFNTIDSQKSLAYHKFPNFNPDQRWFQFTGRHEETSYNLESKPNPGTLISNSKESHLPFHLILKTEDPGILRYQIGEENFSVIMNLYKCITNKILSLYDAGKIKWKENLLLAGFGSAQQAISCTRALKNSMKSISDNITLKMVLKLKKEGKTNNEELRVDPFFFYKLGEIKPAIEQTVIRIAGDNVPQLSQVRKDENIIEIKEQKLLMSLFKIIGRNWQDPFFNVADLCNKMASSKSRLYRSCRKVTGISPIKLIKEYRLQRSLKFFRSQKRVSEILFDSGFNSPSYFSRCFKNRFGIPPYFYQKHLV